ncbi:MAG: methylated-DNA--[protein]-cysteine S-methyltransferase [Candidatus Eisenbacteria bacterium]
MILDLTVTATPLGPIALHALGECLVGVTLDGSTAPDSGVARQLERHLGPYTTRAHDDAAGSASRLARYFGGDWTALEEQPIRLYGTEFQCRIWNALRSIPRGTTWTYAQLADHIGRPRAVRAAGAANGANPVSLFVPCHRVIAADGTLWGYGGGLPRKAWLLRHEGARGVANLEQQALSLT